MTILVDTPLRWSRVDEEARKRGHANKRWCHMVSTVGEEELHQFAQRLGLRREWFHSGHYNITESKRKRAIELGAREATHREVVEALKEEEDVE